MPITHGAIAKIKRNATICKLLDSKRLSYAVIAEMTGTTRNAVGGVAFRHRHPRSALKRSPKSRARTGNMTGAGYQPRSYYPEKTAQNTR